MDNIVVKNWNSNLEWTLVIENLSRKMVVVFFKKWDQFHSHVKDKVHCTIVLNLNSKRMDKFLLQTGFEKISTVLSYKNRLIYTRRYDEDWRNFDFETFLFKVDKLLICYIQNFAYLGRWWGVRLVKHWPYLWLGLLPPGQVSGIVVVFKAKLFGHFLVWRFLGVQIKPV